MMSVLHTVVGAFAIFLVSFCSPALAQMWNVERVQGSAWIQDGNRRVALQIGQSVRMGSQVVTTANGRVKLSGPYGTIMVGPNSSLEMRPGLSGLKMTAVQRVGVVEFDLRKLQRPYFSVETPAMAAVVKGTRFLVVVSGWRSDIGVRQGVVQVQDLRSGQNATLEAGERAVTPERRPGLLVASQNEAPKVRAGAPRAPLVRPERRANAPKVGAKYKIGEDGWAALAPAETAADAGAKDSASGSRGDDSSDDDDAGNEKSSDKGNDKSSDKDKDKSSDKGNDKSSDKGNGKSSNKGNGKSSDKGNDDDNDDDDD
ncbi:MAG: FecR domain-containing protein [Labrys sp. (in: a-proteobacteria)]